MLLKGIVFNYLLILHFILISCNPKEKNTQTTEIYNEVLFSVLDSVQQRHELYDKKIIIGRHESDEVMSFIIEDLRHEFKNDSVGPGTMVMNLADVLKDSIYVNLNSSSPLYNISSGWTSKKLDLAHKINISKKSDFVLLNLSKVILTENKKMGCFYLSVNSSGDPAGYVVFIYRNKKEDEWKIASVLKKWG